MVSLAAPCSCPASSQLRLGFGSRRWGQVRLLVRSAGFSGAGVRLRVRASSSAAAAARGGEGEDGRGFQGSSWGALGKSEPSDAADSFSGWDGSVSDESKQWGKFGGSMGAALGGILLVGAAVFGALSIKQRSSGLKRQMLSLTADQEELLASDEISETVQTEKEGTTIISDSESTQNRSIPEDGTGIHQTSSAPSEASCESTSKSSPGDITDSMSLLDNVNPEANELMSLSSNQEVTTHGDDFVPTSVHLISPDMPMQSVVNFPETTTDTVGLYSDVSLIENVSSDDTPDLAASGIDSTSLYQKIDGASEFQKTDNLYPSTVKSNSAAVQLKESASLNAPVTPKSDAILDLKVEHKASMGTVTSLSGMKDFPLPEAHYLSDEGISLAPDEIVDDKVITHGANVPLLNDIQEDVPDMVRHHKNDGNRIVSESSVSETTLFSAGIPAPSLVSAVLQVSPGKVVVPAIIDQVQMQALVALQVLKVIEADVKPGDLCSRREYARWLVSGSSILSRSTVSKVYPAMYIENVTELAFDDVTPEDPDFPSIQGLAEAGLISSRLSIGGDISNTSSGHHGPILFSPESPLSRQDLVCWKMALEKRELPEVDRKSLYLQSGFLDIDKINPDARPALMVDLSAGEHGIITLAFGYTRLFQPDKPVTKAQAAIALATGEGADIVGEELARIEAESMAEAAVAAHNALVAEVERDINVEFEKELETEREKITIMEKMAEEARLELESLRAEREEEKAALAEGRAAVESEKEILTRLRHDVEEQLENLMSKKTEILFERERIDKLRKEADSESQVITQLHYDLEVEKKALAMARAWAEEEAKKARHQAKVLEEARSWWERQGLKVIVDDELREDATVGATWIHAGGQEVVNENVSEHLKTIERGQGMVHKLKAMAGEMKLKSSASIERLIQKIQSFISFLRKKSADTVTSVRETKNVIFSRASVLADELGKNTSHLSSVVKDGVRKAAVDCRGGLGKFTEKFKT